MLSDMPKIHSFYKFSLESFIVVINRAIDSISENKMYPEESMVPYNENDDKIEDDGQDKDDEQP